MFGCEWNSEGKNEMKETQRWNESNKTCAMCEEMPWIYRSATSVLWFHLLMFIIELEICTCALQIKCQCQHSKKAVFFKHLKSFFISNWSESKNMYLLAFWMWSLAGNFLTWASEHRSKRSKYSKPTTNSKFQFNETETFWWNMNPECMSCISVPTSFHRF